MTALTTPDARLHASWAAAMAEHHPESPHVSGAGLWMLPEAEQWDLTEAGCRRPRRVQPEVGSGELGHPTIEPSGAGPWPTSC